LQASGVVEAVEVAVSAELGGRVAEVLVEEGDPVDAGQVLLRLDGQSLEAQLREAEAAVRTAEATLGVAEAGLNSALAAVETARAALDVALLGAEQTRLAARQAYAAERVGLWERDYPGEFSLPDWYFAREEEREAAEAEMLAARQALDMERALFEEVVGATAAADLREAELRLAQARAAFLVAEALAERELDQTERAFVEDFTDQILENAREELESAQSEYETLLSEAASEEVLEARARLAVATERLETAVDRWQTFLVAEVALPVQAAEALVRQVEAQLHQVEAGVQQAEAGVRQAREAVAQARLRVETLEIQRSKLVVTAPVDGVVLIRNVQPGEILSPAAPVLILSELDQLTITVYVPEDRYGVIGLGDTAQVKVDSFPGERFNAVVTRIADRAEYTPRNVQTEEERSSTVFAVKLEVGDHQGKLKPGMPADVDFTG
jgi:multidrug resistance efflux pump